MIRRTGAASEWNNGAPEFGAGQLLAIVRRNGRRTGRIHDDVKHLIGDVETNQQQPRQQGSRKHVVHRDGVRRKDPHLELGVLEGDGKLVAEKNEDD